MSSPREVLLHYPLPATVRCPRCWLNESAPARVKGEYCDPEHLLKHLRQYHPGDTIWYACGVCGLRGTGRYPQRTVKAHYEAEHAQSPRVDAPGPSTRGADSDSDGESGVARKTSATKATARSTAAADGLTRRRAADPRPPRLRSTATPSPSAAPTPPANETSPSYAAVTAGTTVTKRSSPVTSGARGAAAIRKAAPRLSPTSGGGAAARRTRTTTAASSKCRVLSVDKVDAPIRMATTTSAAPAVPSASRSTARGQPTTARPAVQGAPRAKTRVVAKPPPAARSTRVPSQTPSPPGADSDANSSGELFAFGRGAARKRPPVARSPPQQARAAGASTEKSGSAPRPRPSPPVLRKRVVHSPPSSGGTPTFGGEGGPRNMSLQRSPGITPPVARTSPPVGRRTPPPTTSAAVAEVAATTAAAISRVIAVSAEKIAEIARREMGGVTSRSAGGPVQRTPPERPPARVPSLPQNTRGSPTGTPPWATPSAYPATSIPATLTTCTVTTSVCGGPVMSAGSAAGEWHTPSIRHSPPQPTRGTSPCTAVVRRTPPLPTPPSAEGAAARRQRGAAPTTPPPATSEGDQLGGEWRVQLGRRARRRRSSDSSVGSVSPATSGPRGSRVTPPPASAVDGNNNERTAHKTPPTSEAAGCCGTSLAEREGAARDGTGVEVSAVHPCAPVNVRGVMARRRAQASVVAPREEGGASPASAGGRGGGRRGREPRRADVAGGQPSRRQPAPVPAAMRGRRERLAVRDELAARAPAVATRAELEAFAAEVAAFFGEVVADRARGAAAGSQDRPARSREAGSRRGARGGVGPEGEGASGEGSAPAGPSASGEARGDWVREAKRLQALYRANRRKAVREVLQGPADSCQVPRRQVQEYFERLYRGEEILAGSGVEAERTDPSGSREEFAYLLNPFTEREVDRRLRRMNNSAPGPDGVTYRDLRGADPGTRLLTAMCNCCLRLEAVPASWKTSSTVLVYKKGDRGMLENWRPLALGDTVPKLFAAILADRLTDWAVANRRLSPAQKGFLRDEGCFEHNFVLQEALTDARRSRRQAVVAWLDLSNAFGSIPHATIRRALAGAAVPKGLINIWGSMYDGCTTRVRAAEGFTAPIPIRSGVRQGCPLSPIIFDLAIDSVLRAATDVDAGYHMFNSKFSVLAYADDIALLTETPESMRRLLNAVETEAASVGLRFNPAKCATLHIGTGGCGRVLPTSFSIQGQPVRHLAEGEPYTHLGVPTGFSVDQTPYATIGDLLSDVRAVDRALLAPWQKCDIVGTFILPRLDFLLRGASVEKRPLTAADLAIRKLAKSWLNLPQRASAEGVYMPPRWGGCGLLPLADLADVLSVAHAFRMLTAGDATVRRLAWESLTGVVQRRIGHAPSCESIAAFLSGSQEGRLRGGGEKSLWSRARNAARRLSERLSLRWRWVPETEEMIVECRGPRGAAVKIPPGARNQVVNRLRSAVAEHYAERLLSKPDQGKVFEVSSRVPVSNHFIRGGSFTRFADWRFVHRARLDVLPLNGARRWGDGDKRCRRCGEVSETLPHVLGHCGVHAAAIQLRHNAVLHRLWKACRLPGDKRVNQRIEGIDGELGELRPDLVVRHELSKSVVICDVTVPFENRWMSFEEARGRKIAKYSPLAEELQRRGYRVLVTAFVVGALGSWDPRNEAVLRVLRIGGPYASMMRRLIVSDTIRWSRDIYVEHVSGVRQYQAPSRPAGDGMLATPPRAVRRRWAATVEEVATRCVYP